MFSLGGKRCFQYARGGNLFAEQQGKQQGKNGSTDKSKHQKPAHTATAIQSKYSTETDGQKIARYTAQAGVFLFFPFFRPGEKGFQGKHLIHR